MRIYLTTLSPLLLNSYCCSLYCIWNWMRLEKNNRKNTKQNKTPLCMVMSQRHCYFSFIISLIQVPEEGGIHTFNRFPECLLCVGKCWTLRRQMGEKMGKMGDSFFLFLELIFYQVNAYNTCVCVSINILCFSNEW